MPCTCRWTCNSEVARMRKPGIHAQRAAPLALTCQSVFRADERRLGTEGDPHRILKVLGANWPGHLPVLQAWPGNSSQAGLVSAA
jgi:hypothetical protein